MKLMYSLGGALLAAAALAAPAGASAQPIAYTTYTAYTAKTANLRAGPDRFYPVVAVLPPATQVQVYGCLPDYRWCDVSAGYERGWVYAGNLHYPYRYGYVTFPGIAPYISITILHFVFHDYWYLHYRDRPWYADRDRYVVPPRVLPPPPPPRVLPPPPPPRVLPPPPRVVPPPRVLPGPVVPPPRVSPPPRVEPGPRPPAPAVNEPRGREEAREGDPRRGRADAEEQRQHGR